MVTPATGSALAQVVHPRASLRAEIGKIHPKPEKEGNHCSDLRVRKINYTSSPGVVMNDGQQSSPELYRRAAAKLRDLASETSLPDIKGDLLELAARFERMATYYASQSQAREPDRKGSE